MQRPARAALVLAAAGAAALATTLPALAGPASDGPVRVAGDLTSYTGAVPAGATATVRSVETGSGKTIVTLHVRGLQPETEYGAHAHTNPCGLTGAAAGPHFQNVLDPVTPSVDPAYANPENEIWLDLTTNAAGNGTAKAVVDWTMDDRSAQSVVLHERHTSTGAGQAGVAGARLACLTVAF